MRSKLETSLTVVLVLAAVAVASSAVRNAFFAGPADTRKKPVYVDRWREALPLGRYVGGQAGAPTKIVAFVDFECPGCAVFHQVLERVVAERRDVEALYVHYPLDYHRFALPAARAGECAADLGSFDVWASAVFRKRDSIGLKSWGSFAQEAGILDTARIAACAGSAASVAAIDRGMAFAGEIRLDATPTVIVNGWRLPGTPTKPQLDSVLVALASGERNPSLLSRLWR